VAQVAPSLELLFDRLSRTLALEADQVDYVWAKLAFGVDIAVMLFALVEAPVAELGGSH